VSDCTEKDTVAAAARETFVETNWNESYFCHNRTIHPKVANKNNW